MFSPQAVGSTPQPPSEWLLLQDRHSLQTWSVTPRAWGAHGVRHQVEHEPGLTRVLHQRGALHCELQCCSDQQQGVQQRSLRLHNLGDAPLTLRLVAVLDWPPADAAEADAGVTSSLHRQRLLRGQLTTLLATLPAAGHGGSQHTRWLAMASPDTGRGSSLDDGVDDWTCDCRELRDVLGQPLLPSRLGCQPGTGHTACAALAQTVTVAPGQRLGKVFLFGHAASPDAARAQANAAAAVWPAQRQAEAMAFWRQQPIAGGQASAAPQPRWPSPLHDPAAVV